MNCPYCNTHIDEHPASRCLDAWVAETVMDGDVRPDPDGDGIWVWFKKNWGYSDVVPYYSTSIAAAKDASDKAGSTVIFAPHSSIIGDYANRKNDWLVEMIPKGGITEDSVWAYGGTEELARCRVAIKAKGNSR